MSDIRRLWELWLSGDIELSAGMLEEITTALFPDAPGRAPAALQQVIFD